MTPALARPRMFQATRLRGRCRRAPLRCTVDCAAA